MIHPSKAALSVAALLISIAPVLLADKFGPDGAGFEMEFVTIGNPGNPPDPQSQFTNKWEEAEDQYRWDEAAGGDVLIGRAKIYTEQFAPGRYGAVAQEFRIGKHEVSRDMILKANALGKLGILLGTGGTKDAAATGLSWFEAARFVNWLNTSRGYPPAYKFRFQPGQNGYVASVGPLLKWEKGEAGYDSSNPWRNSRAVYFLPNENEWHKAAYYNPSAGNYWAYATGSDTLPVAVLSGTQAGTAVYTGLFDRRMLAYLPSRLTGLPDFVPTAPASIFAAGGLSPSGTMGQGGNAREWVESAFDPRLGEQGPHVLRGGQWSRIDWNRPNYEALLKRGGWQRLLLAAGTSETLVSAVRVPDSPMSKDFANGFRVASLPTSRFGAKGGIPSPAAPPAAPGPEFVSPFLDDSENTGVSGHRDGSGQFILSVSPSWISSAVPKAFDLEIAVYAEGAVLAEDTGGGKRGQAREPELESTLFPVVGATIEIDRDADGIYETTRIVPAGVDASIKVSTPKLPRKMGAHRVRARWLAPSGDWIVSEARFYIGMEPGVSILDGAEFTNRLDVSLSLLAPVGSAGAILANDGGFRRNLQDVDFDLVTEPRLPFELDWTLAQADQGRGARIVYVRFVGENGSVLKEHNSSDDIIYDANAPELLRAELSAEPSPVAGRKASRQIKLRINAKDDRSGVALMQLSRGDRPSSRSAQTLKYAVRRNVPRAGGPVWVRVQDKAGNWSPWKRSEVGGSQNIDRTPPGLAITRPAPGGTASTKSASYAVSFRATDNLSAVELRYRVRRAGQKSEVAWQTAVLPGKGGSKSLQQTVLLPKKGLWEIDMQVADQQRNLSPIRTVTVRRR